MSITLFLKSPFPPLFPFPRDSRIFIRICLFLDMGFVKCIPVFAYLISDFEGWGRGRRAKGDLFVYFWVVNSWGFEISKPIFYLKKEVIIKCNKRNREGKKEMLI